MRYVIASEQIGGLLASRRKFDPNIAQANLLTVQTIIVHVLHHFQFGTNVTQTVR